MDKRPLGFMGAVFFIIAIILSKFGFDKAVYILPVFLLAVFFVLFKRHNIKFFALIVSAVFCAVSIFYVADTDFRTKEECFRGEEAYIQGVICEIPYSSQTKNYYVIKTDSVNGQEVHLKIKVWNVKRIGTEKLYDNVKLKANLTASDDMGDYGENIYRPHKITHTGACIDGTLKIAENENKPFMYYIMSYRHNLFESVEELLPNDIGGLIAGITIGEKELLSSETLEQFRITGTSHILVVSGMHVAILSGFFYFVLKRFLNVKISCVCSILFILLFMTFTGFTPSVMRSGIMIILSYIAKLFDEKQDSFNSLGLSALILICIKPFSVYNVGTVFSYASVYGILLMNRFVLPYVKNFMFKIKFRILRKILLGAVSLILVSLSAQLFTFPISVLYNIEFSFISVVGNFFVSLLCNAVMITGAVGMVLLNVIPNFLLSKVFFGTSIIFSRIVLSIVSKIAEFEQFYKNVTNIQNFVFLFLLAVTLFFIICAKLPPKRKTALFSLLMVPIFLISNFTSTLINTYFVKFSVIDVGYGLCVTAAYSGEAVMFACGGDSEDKIIDYLSFSGVKSIKSLFLPLGKSMMQIDQAYNVGRKFDIESIITPAGYDFSKTGKKSVSADYASCEYWDGLMTVDFYTRNNCSFAFVRIADTRILISFYGKIRDEFLPHHCQNPDIYVTMYQNTFKTDFSGTKEYVISNSYEASVPASAKNIHATYNDSTYTKFIRV